MRGANKDPDFRNRVKVGDEEFERLVRHVDKVLLTRGMVGTVITSVDAETRALLAGSSLRESRQRSAASDKLPPVQNLPDGVYEQLLTDGLVGRLGELQHATRAVEDAEASGALATHLSQQLLTALTRLPPAERVELANRVLTAIDSDDRIVAGPKELLAVARLEQPGVWRLLQTRPAVPLSRPALLTNSASDPKLGAELRAELATADGVDLLCAFVKWYGLRVLEAELAALRDRGKPLRVLTTTYMGATDKTALDRLVRDFGAQVRINYETQSTRHYEPSPAFPRACGDSTEPLAGLASGSVRPPKSD